MEHLLLLLKRLIDKDILEEYHIQTDRVQFDGEGDADAKLLNEAQQNALR